MCEPLAGWLGKKATKLLSVWRHHNDFPAAQWRNLLGQTLARCVGLRMQVEREVVELRVKAAEYLQSGLLHRADDKVAIAIRKHKMYLVYLLIQDYCEHAINHLSEIEDCQKKECPSEVREAISSLLYVMPRCEELVELHLLKPLISSKFGKSFVSEVAEHSIQCAVDKKIMLLLSLSVPNWPIRKTMLEKIALDFDINWRSDTRKSYGNNEVLTSSSSRKSWIEPWQKSYNKKLTKVNSKNNVLTSYSLRKSSHKNNLLAFSSSQKRSIECIHPPPFERKLNEVKSLHLANSKIKKSSYRAANKEDEDAKSTSVLRVAIHNVSNATFGDNGLSKIHVSSNDSHINDGEGTSTKISYKPSHLPEFEELKAQLMILKRRKQHAP